MLTDELQKNQKEEPVTEEHAYSICVTIAVSARSVARIGSSSTKMCATSVDKHTSIATYVGREGRRHVIL